jgi:hypothetical protein
MALAFLPLLIVRQNFDVLVVSRTVKRLVFKPIHEVREQHLHQRPIYPSNVECLHEKRNDANK